MSTEVKFENDHSQLKILFPLKKIVSAKVSKKRNNKVLVVEDNPVNRMLMEKIVEKMGHTVITAENGVEGVQKNIENKPGIILMDIQMPIMDGIEATKKIRTTHEDTVIIALTANANREECLRAGMNNYLPKPTLPNDIKNMLDHYMAS